MKQQNQLHQIVNIIFVSVKVDYVPNDEDEIAVKKDEIVGIERKIAGSSMYMVGWFFNSQMHGN